VNKETTHRSAAIVWHCAREQVFCPPVAEIAPDGHPACAVADEYGRDRHEGDQEEWTGRNQSPFLIKFRI